MPRSLQPPGLSLDYTCPGGRGPRPRLNTHVSGPPLNPSLWPGGENTAPHGLPYASPAPQPAAPPPTTSSLRPGMACKAWRDLAGPLARGLTSGLGKLAF